MDVTCAIRNIKKTEMTFCSKHTFSVVLYVSGRYVVTDIEANDGFWHFICVTWESKEGRWAVFLDGSLFSNGTLLSKDSVIPGGGKLVSHGKHNISIILK